MARLGRTSVRYELGLFAERDAPGAAHGRFVHVYVDPGTRRPVELPPLLKNALQGLL